MELIHPSDKYQCNTSISTTVSYFHVNLDLVCFLSIYRYLCFIIPFDLLLLATVVSASLQTARPSGELLSLHWLFCQTCVKLFFRRIIEDFGKTTFLRNIVVIGKLFLGKYWHYWQTIWDILKLLRSYFLFLAMLFVSLYSLCTLNISSTPVFFFFRFSLDS